MMRRAAALLFAVLVLVVISVGSIVSALGAPRLLTIATALPVATLVVLFVAAAVGLRRIGRPIGDIVEASARVADGEFDARVRIHGSGPIRIVGGAFNRMAERLQAQDRQRRELMADIAHELRTPLSALRGRIEGLADGVYPRTDAQMNELLEDVRVLTRLVDDLGTLANAESGSLTLRKEPTDPGELAAESVAALSDDARRSDVTMKTEIASSVPSIDIDPIRIREVLLNLLSNALQHTPAGGTITLGVRHDDKAVEFTVRDTGTGIAVEDLPHIFDRFYKGHGSRGSGLGLTIARNLVTAHGGTITATSEAGKGTMMAVRIPAKTTESAPFPS